MVQSMRKRSQLKKRIAGNDGIALITVIVAIGFIAALVSIVLMTTLINFKMKATNTRSKDTFYSAEQVLDEINVGLQRRVSDAVSTSYIQIMEDYGAYDNDIKQEMMMTRYYERLWSYLEDPDTPGHSRYSVNTLESFLKESTKWHGEDAGGEGGWGAIVTAVADDGTESKSGEMITYTKQGVILKNVKIYYKDSMGFVSVLQTDIRLAYPEFEFATSSMIADITEYSFIADGGFETKTAAGGENKEQKLSIDGNIYANNFISSGVNVEIAPTKRFISKYDISIDKKASFVTGEDTDIWATNLKVKSSELNLNGNISVANDLNIMGRNSIVTLKGIYTGYGTDTVNPDRSSAILVNGTGTTIDMSSLSGITVAGRAFVGTEKAEDKFKELYGSAIYDVERPETMEDLKNIYTGQSLASKADQLCYLVPAEAIGVDNMTNRSLYNKNPLTKDEYDEIKKEIEASKTNPDKDYVMVSDSVKVMTKKDPVTGQEISTSLADYLNYPFTAGEEKVLPNVYYHEVRVSDPNVGSLVYLYMLFEDENAANRYYNDYYSAYKPEVDKNTKNYISEVKYPKNINQLSTNSTAANMTIGSYNSEEGFSLNIQTRDNASTVLDDNRQDYSRRFSALCSKLTENYKELKDCRSAASKDTIEDEEEYALTHATEVRENYQVVFENIVDVDRLKKFCALAYTVGSEAGTALPSGVTLYASATQQLVKLVDSEGNTVVICGENSTFNNIDNENIHLVISASNNNIALSVTDFSGLILCNGKLIKTATDNMTYTANADPAAVRSLLTVGFDATDSETGITQTHAVASVLKNGSDYVYRPGDNSPDSMDTSLRGIITYENWKKE